MALNTKTFAQLVSDQVTAIQASSARLINTTIGSIVRALAESNAGVALWMQSLLLKLLARTRASTSTGEDLDTWMSDFAVSRLPAVSAVGDVTFSRFTATNAATIPVGASVQSRDGQQSFQVVADTTNPAYADGAFMLGAGVSSIDVRVQAAVPGAGGNVVAGGISVLATAISGVDTVTNAAAFTNGSDAETDVAIRARFVAYVASLSKGTQAAIAYAISSLQIGLQHSFVENEQYSGATDYGYFYVVVDDGTGAPGSIVLNSVANAIEAVRPVTSRFGVFAPVINTANVAMTAAIGPGYDAAATKLIVQNAVRDYVNSLTLGQPLVYTRLLQVAYNASAGVTAITGLLINGGTVDIAATPKQVVKAGTVGVA